VLAAATAAGALAIPSFADAQSRGYRYDESDRYYREACRDRKRDARVAGGVIGAIVGGVAGSNLDDDGNRAEGTVLGAAAGAVVGSQVGRSSVKCDRTGAYWTRGETYGYSDSYYYRGRYRDDWYTRRNCRWARDWRGDYVRVCPDRRGRYRITY